MALRTPEEFIQSIADLHLQIYLFGEKVDDYVHHPVIRPSINCIAMTYELAQAAGVRRPHARHEPPERREGQPLHAHPPVDRRPRQEGQDAAPAGPEDGLLLPALRGHGRDQRPVLRHLRDRPGARHGLPRALQGVRALSAGQRPRRRRRHDRPQGRPQPGAAPAARPGRVRARGRAPRGRHRGPRRQGPPDGRLQLARGRGHAHGGHARGRRGLRRLLQLPGERARHQLHLRASELRHAQARGERPGRGQHAVRRPGSPDGLRRRVRAVGARLPVRRDRVLRRARGAVRRLPPPELRRLQGRRRRRAHRRRRPGRRLQRRRPGQPRQGQDHRDDAPERDAVLAAGWPAPTRACRCRPATTRSTCCWPTCASRT